MTTNNRLILALVMLSLWPPAALGGPPDAAAEKPQPAAVGASAEAVKPPEKAPTNELQTKIVPFLGTATTEPTPEERKAAGLPDGVGLSVQCVLPGSPAAAAGLRRQDVLHKLSDQILVNDPQFRVLIRTHQPGDEIELTVIRRGEPIRVTALLQQREVPVGEVPPDELLRWLLRPTPRVGPAIARAVFSASYEDDTHLLILTTDEQGRYLLAREKQGGVLFDGPVNTPEQRRAVPQPIQPKLRRLETPPKSTPKVIQPDLQAREALPPPTSPAAPTPAAPAATSR